jgi:hypothetical protein
MMRKRLGFDKGRIEYDGDVLIRLANNPILPKELLDDDRLSFKEGLEPVTDDPDIPTDLRDKLLTHGYLHTE